MVFPGPPLGAPDEPFHCDVAAQRDPTQAGQFDVTVRLQIAPGWHAYANTLPGSPYSGTVVKLELPEEVEAIGQWDKPLALPDIKNPQQTTYSGTVVFSHKVRLKPGSSKANLTVQINYQVCDDQKCLPQATIKKSVLIGDQP